MTEALRLHEPSPQEREEASPLLIQAIANCSGQGAKVEELLWSAWNGNHKTGLCDCLCGLDTKIGEAVIAMLAARVQLGGDADPLLKKIIDQSGTTCPANNQPQ